MSPRITIGCATYNDYEGVWCTIQSIFLHNEWENPDDVEVVIVDTSPVGSEHKRLVKGLVPHHNIKYVELPQIVGTTYPRDLIFDIATAPYVVVMDCHVMLPSNALLKLLNWFEANPDNQDLIQGPMFYDNLQAFATHCADQFRGGMWGTWSTMWKSPNGELFSVEGEEVTDEPRPRKPNPTIAYHDPFTLSRKNMPGLPAVPWGGHERKLKEAGCVQLGSDPNHDPFPIPGMGMGLFASRKDSWLGFAKHCSGFGGEEMNIHLKYRQAGRQALCLPFLRWNHRFGRAGGAPYPIPLAAKIRNYVLWANELGNPTFEDGRTLLDRIHTHFVGASFPEKRWKELLADPINFPVSLKAPTNVSKPLDELFQKIANTPRDLNENAENIRALVYQTQSVRAFVKRGEWETILAAGFPNRLDIYQTENSPLIEQTHKAHEQQSVKDNRKLETYNTYRPTKSAIDIESAPCELLVVDQEMNGEFLYKFLLKHAPTTSKYILIRGTQAFGLTAEFDPNKPGMYSAIQAFLGDNPDWFVADHWVKQYGATILGRKPLPPPEKEIRPWPLGFGPGTELKAILSSVGINPSANCSCNARMRQMDEWGVEGCKENFDTIVGWLEEKAADWGWTKAAENAIPPDQQISLGEKLAIGWKSLMTGIAFKVDWSNPYPGLVTEAIKRAEKKQRE